MGQDWPPGTLGKWPEVAWPARRSQAGNHTCLFLCLSALDFLAKHLFPIAFTRRIWFTFECLWLISMTLISIFFCWWFLLHSCFLRLGEQPDFEYPCPFNQDKLTIWAWICRIAAPTGMEYIRVVYCHPAYLTYSRAHHAKCQAGWSTSWNQDRREKYQ